MLIDCDSCGARGVRCAGCVVTMMFADAGERPAPGARPVGSGSWGADERWDADELRALRVLGAAGLLPALEELADAVLERGARRASPPRRAS
ncbi:4Fe-4S ferredoxin-type domain-containing protein [Frankia sp. AiPs1]|uniref:hypothetical protein n=1 Tax=Frankia sp. AiPa1 TaxID=573492 RepID=UPI00202B5B2A|nr:hypothetical protein [Frankia sp. AiPa1]MCL9762357.1 hypothetical protein [Frankia sp. AiPa1]